MTLSAIFTSKKMIDLKTTSLFRLLCLLMKKPNSKLNLDRFCYLLGQFFQIRDDYINLTNEEYQKLKGFAEDLTEGKFSFPIIHGIRKDPKDSTILSKLDLGTVCFSSQIDLLSSSFGQFSPCFSPHSTFSQAF